jgi:hypothetical protein
VDLCRKYWTQIWVTTCHDSNPTKGQLPPLHAEIEETSRMKRNDQSFPKQTAQSRGGHVWSCPVKLVAAVTTSLMMSPKLSDPYNNSIRSNLVFDGIYRIGLLDSSLRTVANIHP